MQGNINIPDSTITTNLSFRQLVLMNMQQLTNFPYIEKDFDALTDYELLSLVVKFLNDVIANQNEQNASITRMYESFLALQTYVNNTKDTLEDAFNELDDYVRNYFDNLDVQEEINNKLDQMLKDGVLEQIIEQFIQSTAIWCFDTVSDMQSATNLIDGSYARTIGYYSANDGGGSLFKITKDESLSEYQIELNNNLYATLIINNEVNVHQFGAYGDNTHDDTESIKSALNSSAHKINFIKNKTYLVTPYISSDEEHNIIIPSNKEVDLCESTIKVIPNDKEKYKVFSFLDTSNSSLKNGNIIGDVGYHTGQTGEWGYGVSIQHSNNIKLKNLYITKCWGDGIDINRKDNENFLSEYITIKDCICDDNRRQGMSIEAGNYIYVENCKFINTGTTAGTNPKAGVDIEPLISNNTLNDITFINCVFSKNKGMQFVGGGNTSNNIIVKNLTLDNCIFDDTNTSSEYVLWMKDVTDSKLINSHIGNNKKLVLQPSNNFLFANNNVTVFQISTMFDYCSNSIIKIENNFIKTPSNLKSTIGLIQNYSTQPNTNQNNTLIIDGNTIIDKTSGDYVYDPGLINILYEQGCDKLIITNNYLQGSKNGIALGCSSIIKNNIIVGTTNYATRIVAVDNETIKYFDIENNQFQNCGSETSIIFNYYKKNLVLRNNIYYPIYFNNGIGSTNYTKTKYLVYETGLTGYNLIEDNNIISLTE